MFAILITKEKKSAKIRMEFFVQFLQVQSLIRIYNV